MRKFNVLLLLLIALFLTASITWLALDSIDTVKAEKIDIRLILKTKPDRLSFWSQMAEGALIAGSEYDANIRVNAPERETDIADQIEMVSRAIEEDVDIIIIAATDYYKLSEICENAVNAGIVVVTIDSDVELEQEHSYIATNNLNASKRLSHELAGRLDEKGQVLIIGHVEGSSTSVDRIDGFRQGLKPYSDVGVYEKILYSDDDEQRAYELTKEFIEDQHTLDAIYATNEVSLTGVGRAIQDLNLEEDILIVGFDVNNKIMMMLQDGAVDITMIQRPYNMGYLAVEKAIQQLNYSEVGGIDTGAVMITKEVMFYPENQRLLVPGARKYRSE